MASSNFTQGPDLASLLSMIQAGGQVPQNIGGQQGQRQQHNSSSGGKPVQSGGNGPDPSIMSSLFQGIASNMNQQHTNGGSADIMSLLGGGQLGPRGLNNNGGQGLNIAALGVLGNQQPNNQALLSTLLNSQQQRSQPSQNQEQALALARLAGARLLSGDEARQAADRNNGIAKGISSENSSPFLTHRNNVISDSGEEPTRARNLEPGTVAVPCRARGMPMDHNPLTAYFVVSKNIQHGEDVVCSHRGCRNAGVKFRYCSFCKAPVAKRNFRRRHNHGSDTSATGSDDADDESAKMSTTSATSSRRLISASEADEPEAKRAKTVSSEDDDVETTTDSSKSSDSNGSKTKKKSCSADESSPPSPKKASVSEQAENLTVLGEADSSTATIKTSGKSISQERRLEWADLLEQRPATNDPESMSKWIDKILKVSEAGQAGKYAAKH